MYGIPFDNERFLRNLMKFDVGFMKVRVASAKNEIRSVALEFLRRREPFFSLISRDKTFE
jgi:hypothetical protein